MEKNKMKSFVLMLAVFFAVVTLAHAVSSTSSVGQDENEGPAIEVEGAEVCPPAEINK